MAYVSKTDSTHSKWIITGTGSVVNRFSEVMDDQADGPYYDVASAWTQSAGDAAEYYHAPTKRPDNVYVSGTKLTEKADDLCIDGGGAGLANGEWCWMTASSRVYVQVAAGSPGANADFYYDWNGSVSGTNFLTEIVADSMYRIHLALDIGDGTTATTLTSNAEHVRYDDNTTQSLKANATLQIGSIVAGMGCNGSTWSFYHGAEADSEKPFGSYVGTFYCYGSFLEFRKNASVSIRSNVCTIKNSILSSLVTGVYSIEFYQASGRVITVDKTTVGFTSATNKSFSVAGGPVGTTYVTTNASTLAAYSGANVSLSDCTFTQNYYVYMHLGYSLTLIDTTEPTTKGIGSAAGFILSRKTCNIHIADKDGVDLAGATVDCEDQTGTAVWTAGTVTTDANGDITEQTITYKQWAGTSETLTTYSPHKFTISAAGYETLTLDNITVDGPIDWHLELQDPAQAAGKNKNFSHMVRIN